MSDATLTLPGPTIENNIIGHYTRCNADENDGRVRNGLASVCVEAVVRHVSDSNFDRICRIAVARENSRRDESLFRCSFDPSKLHILHMRLIDRSGTRSLFGVFAEFRNERRRTTSARNVQFRISHLAAIRILNFFFLQIIRNSSTIAYFDCATVRASIHYKLQIRRDSKRMWRAKRASSDGKSWLSRQPALLAQPTHSLEFFFVSKMSESLPCGDVWDCCRKCTMEILLQSICDVKSNS